MQKVKLRKFYWDGSTHLVTLTNYDPDSQQVLVVDKREMKELKVWGFNDKESNCQYVNLPQTFDSTKHKVVILDREAEPVETQVSSTPHEQQVINKFLLSSEARNEVLKTYPEALCLAPDDKSNLFTVFNKNEEKDSNILATGRDWDEAWNNALAQIKQEKPPVVYPPRMLADWELSKRACEAINRDSPGCRPALPATLERFAEGWNIWDEKEKKLLREAWITRLSKKKQKENLTEKKCANYQEIPTAFNFQVDISMSSV